MLVSNKEIPRVVDTAAQVSVINISLFEQVVPRPKLQERITKSTKLQSLWKGPPYLKATVKSTNALSDERQKIRVLDTP